MDSDLGYNMTVATHIGGLIVLCVLCVIGWIDIRQHLRRLGAAECDSGKGCNPHPHPHPLDRHELRQHVQLKVSCDTTEAQSLIAERLRALDEIGRHLGRWEHKHLAGVRQHGN